MVSQNVFHFGSNLQKMCQITALSTIYQKRRCSVILHRFLEIGPKVNLIVIKSPVESFDEEVFKQKIHQASLYIINS